MPYYFIVDENGIIYSDIGYSFPDDLEEMVHTYNAENGTKLKVAEEKEIRDWLDAEPIYSD